MTENGIVVEIMSKLDRNGYAPTIMTEYDGKCFFTGSTSNLVRHEVFYGTANRKLSKEWGCWVYLTPQMHNMSNQGVHFNKENDLVLHAWRRRGFGFPLHLERSV